MGRPVVKPSGHGMLWERRELLEKCRRGSATTGPQDKGGIWDQPQMQSRIAHNLGVATYQRLPRDSLAPLREDDVQLAILCGMRWGCGRGWGWGWRRGMGMGSETRDGVGDGDGDDGWGWGR